MAHVEIFSEGPGRTARATSVSKYITEIYFVRLSHDKVAFDVDCHVSTAASLHQAMWSIVYVSLFVALWHAAIGAFRS